MRKHILIVMTAILVLALATVAMAGDPFVGTWKWNPAKSKINPGPPDKSSTVKITAQDNGIKLVANGVDSEGKATHNEYAAKFDGKDYPITGIAEIDTIALKRIDANNFDDVVKKGGKEYGRGVNAVSKDGKTYTHTIHPKNAKGEVITSIYVFDKQ